MCFSRPSIPAAPPPPPPVATEQDQAVLAAQDAERKRRAMAQGRQSTILTGPMGAPVTQASYAPKTLLGG